jgi:hypothetical protein
MRCGSPSGWASTTAPTDAGRTRISGLECGAYSLPAVPDDAADAGRVDRDRRITEDNVAAHLLERTQDAAPAGHVFTLHANWKGCAWRPHSSN